MIQNVAVNVENGNIVPPEGDLSYMHIVSGIVIIHENDLRLVSRYGWRRCDWAGAGKLADGYIVVRRD